MRSGSAKPAMAGATDSRSQVWYQQNDAWTVLTVVLGITRIKRLEIPGLKLDCV